MRVRVEPRLVRGTWASGATGSGISASEVTGSGNTFLDKLCRPPQQAAWADVQRRGVRCADLVGEPVTGDVDFYDPHRAPPFYVVEHIQT
ncbi:DNA polymerase iii, alpha subunit, gram-positive type [Mycolicibacterium brisbanense]|uniref:DNA polymerase iii, alpha subunit, gram-positive type n=1 Tax=Mycolicibacterium brisbanense TaxID=146020 RepID=A0A124E171_9MYCO|nr:DNA polymerase iii, alpha subunit, gram-positive type [Mycolicibacterium brisbanense]